ncbi:MAG: TonB C-terminal domain-containing protein [Gemmatimonadota bacterium]|nr:TonB C-terminal domain-containing protein [Gemmatimonadota bacterium]
MIAHRGEPRHLGPFALSALFHAALGTLAFQSLKQPKPVALPPMYRVNIVAAPAGERAIGEVKPDAPTAATPVTQPSAPQSSAKEMPLPAAKPVSKPPVRATPTVAKPAPAAKPSATAPTDAKPVPPTESDAPKAGGGPDGGKGTDVATVRSDGIEFPFPGYLNNIVRQIALTFKPRTEARLKAEVRFLIHRDGSVSGLAFVRRSGVFSFDLEAQGAVEAASSTRRFGPLPAGFPDDVLPVVFSFDPEFLR